MADYVERVKLEDEAVEKIAGGQLNTLSTRSGIRKCWTDGNPDVIYTFDKVQSIYTFQSYHPEYQNDDEALVQALLAEGIIRPL